MKKIALAALPLILALLLSAPVVEAKGAVVVARPVVTARPAVVSAPTPKPVLVAESSSSKASKADKSLSTTRPIVLPATSFSDDCEKKTLRCE